MIWIDRAFFGLMTVLSLAIASCTASAGKPSAARLIEQSRDGRLNYGADANGNRIPDFSHAGYRGGGVKLPNVGVAAEVEPGDGDDGERIQRAIDDVSALPLDKNGFRGAVLLRRGDYQIENHLRIAASGVVLRGEGDGKRGTRLIATGASRRTLIIVSGGRGEQDINADLNGDRVRPMKEIGPREIDGTRTAIADRYVPVGARRFNVEDASKFSVGDTVIVHRSSTSEWIAELGMNQIPPRPGEDGIEVKQWSPGSRDLEFDRVITAINGNQITIDAPITNAIERRWGGGAVYKYEFPERLNNVGIESLSGISEFAGSNDENHSWTFIRLDVVQNAWVRNATARHFAYSLVEVERFAKWITVQDCQCIDPVSQIVGSRRYSFSVSGQMTLVQRCTARNGRHDFVHRHETVCGPNVFLDCEAERAHSDSGPHCRWSCGTLYDNVRIRGNDLNVMNRGNAGTGHGWTGANFVFWNCRAETIHCENPPTAQNWAIGCRAKKHGGNGHWVSPGRIVRPQSLYLAQLRERVGADAVKTLGYR